MDDIFQITYHFANLLKHGVDEVEAEAALYDGWARRRKDGDNLEVLGRTDEGRYLQLVAKLQPGGVLVFHGRDMNEAERRRYRRK